MKRTLFCHSTMALLCALGLPLSAWSAPPVGTVKQVDGVALVTQDGQYVQAYPGLRLTEGDRIMTSELGRVTLDFGGGCMHTMGELEMVTVGAGDFCAPGQKTADINQLQQNATGQYADPVTGHYSSGGQPYQPAPGAGLGGYAYQPAATPPGGTPGVTASDAPATGAGSGVSGTTVAMVAGGAAAGVLLMQVLDDDDDDRPPPPPPPVSP